jgi:HD-like signal output (HDOD) protein
VTVAPLPRRTRDTMTATLAAEPHLDLEKVLGGLDTMATQRPVAARIVSVANSDDTDARGLARILATDVALASRVMRLANSAYFGMRGRVTSLQFAVTVVGFSTVRTMATVALADLDDESRLPADFWDVSTSLALSAAALAPRFGERPQDALCIGLLAQMGIALLHATDPDGYAELVAAELAFVDRRAAEVQRYGIHALRLTAVALEEWGFPRGMLVPLRRVDDMAAVEGGLLRVAFELAGRLTAEGHEPVPVEHLSCGAVREDDVVQVLEDVRADADELRQAMLG